MSAMTAYFILPSLPYDLESAKLSGRRTECFLFALYQPAQPRLPHCLAKGVQFLPLALRDHLDTTVVEIAHRARDFKTRRDRLHRITKPHSLHATGIKHRHSLAAHRLNLRGGDKATSTAEGA